MDGQRKYMGQSTMFKENIINVISFCQALTKAYSRSISILWSLTLDHTTCYLFKSLNPINTTSERYRTTGLSKHVWKQYFAIGRLLHWYIHKFYLNAECFWVFVSVGFYLLLWNMDRGGSWGQTACVTCNILRLCWDIKYNISITISGQTQVPTSHLPNISVFSSLYSRKVGTATNVYTEHLSSEQHTQILSGPAQENTPILSK